ncbi:MAG: 5-oxoprolinase subunit PxpB [Gemmatimonadota bacterium]|nr:5-oxoprolinase subunit PxpB [Gemmatimonadota bacterium]
MSHPTPVALPLGESAVTLSWGTTVSADLNALVHHAARIIRAAALPSVEDIVPGYAVLTVFYDPLHTAFGVMADRLLELLQSSGGEQETGPAPAEHVIPVCYDGPDLDEVARQTGLPVAEVIARHTAREYRVYLLGFVPGFAYLGELDPALVVPRRGSPRKRIPAGSVAIAGQQTAIYPLDTPGGWHLIGRTSAVMFDPVREPASLLGPGDLVRFVSGPG